METKKTILILATFLIVQIGFGQNQNVCPIVKFDTDWSEEICIQYKNQSQFYSFVDNREAIEYVQKLMDLAGLPMNFIVSECSGIQNAFAYTYDGVQYIFYGNEFLKSLNFNSNDIGSITVLAHEIGHHLAGHTSANSYINQYCVNVPCNEQSQDCLDALEISRKRELQADRFAGYIMYKFGSSLSETQEAFRLLLNNQDYDDECSTHPTLSKRLNAIKEGYNKAKKQEDSVLERQEKRDKGEDIEEPTEKEKLEDIKGEKIELYIPNLDILERNKIINRLRDFIVNDVRNYLKSNSEYELENSARNDNVSSGKINKYLGDQSYAQRKSDGSINSEEEYFLYNVASLKLKNDERVNFGPALGYHSKNGIVKIIQFSDLDEPKVIYSSIADSEQIDYNEVKGLFINIFKIGLQKEIDNVYSTNKSENNLKNLNELNVIQDNFLPSNLKNAKKIISENNLYQDGTTYRVLSSYKSTFRDCFKCNKPSNPYDCNAKYVVENREYTYWKEGKKERVWTKSVSVFMGCGTW